MDDRNIIALLFSRSEDGLQALEKKPTIGRTGFPCGRTFLV